MNFNNQRHFDGEKKDVKYKYLFYVSMQNSDRQELTPAIGGANTKGGGGSTLANGGAALREFSDD